MKSKVDVIINTHLGPEAKIENGTEVTAVLIEQLIHKGVKVKIAKIDTGKKSH